MIIRERSALFSEHAWRILVSPGDIRAETANWQQAPRLMINPSPDSGQ